MPKEFAHGHIDQAFRVERAPRTSLLELTPDEHLRLIGWAAAKHPESVFEKLYFVIDDVLWLPVAYGVSRPDLAAHRPNRLPRKAGFDVTLSMRHIPLGVHSLAIAGTIGRRAQRLTAELTLTILEWPQLASRIGAPATHHGRIRVLRDTLPEQPPSGRASGAIRRGASLMIEGWSIAADRTAPTDEMRLVLVGAQATYRLHVQRRAEPEAGVAFGIDAISAGYSAYVDCTDMEPGGYDIVTEHRVHGEWTSANTGRSIEIVGEMPNWLPSGLPRYQAPIASTLDHPLPARIVQGEDLLVRGRFDTSARMLAAFAQFDGERTYGLTFTERKRTEREGAERSYFFAGLLAPPLPAGEHRLEILILDENRAGVWRIVEHTFLVDAFALRTMTSTAV